MTASSKSVSEGSHLIRRILTPAIRLWLTSQVEQAEQLAIALDSSDRQILSGYIPSAQMAACSVIYRGLHFSSINVTARTIRTNGLRILKGDAFKLLEPLPIEVSLTLTEANLNRSLQSPLFAGAVDDLMQRIVVHCFDWPRLEEAPLGEGPLKGKQAANGRLSLDNPQISVTSNKLVIGGKLVAGHGGTGTLMNGMGDGVSILNDDLNDDNRDHDRTVPLEKGAIPLRVETDLTLKDGRTLVFDNLQVTVGGVSLEGRSPTSLTPFTLDLGETTEMNTITLAHQHLTCQGRIMVMP